METIKKVTMTEMIMDKIAEKIISGELKAGEKLPTERDLAEGFGVTRSRVREALRALSLIGLIDIRPSGGSFVAKPDGLMPEETVLWVYHKEMNSLDDVYAARKLIETEVYLACFERKTDAIIEQMGLYLNQFEAQIGKRAKAEELMSILEELDMYVAKMCGNGVYIKLMQTIILLRRESGHKILKMKESKKSAVVARRRILDAFEQDDKELLKERLDAFYTDSLDNLRAKD